MVTDSLASEIDFAEGPAGRGSVNKRFPTSNATPTLVRTITIRGFDASDEGVDREAVLTNICEATPETIRVGRSKRKGLDVAQHLQCLNGIIRIVHVIVGS